MARSLQGVNHFLATGAFNVASCFCRMAKSVGSTAVGTRRLAILANSPLRIDASNVPIDGQPTAVKTASRIGNNTVSQSGVEVLYHGDGDGGGVVSG